ncbi:hypothetical protein MAFF241647_18310 [Ralstonia solanacearum]|nr:hypothetical protein MAFF241647_18310 [Ralstonia solanacearum]BCM99408.1 hypothetical protein RPSA_19450 [Ralstonia solanacearum]BEU56995.1 hypothetical protein MAFF211521_20480 [Ralstonia pseudosolanacearum]BEU62320.1 hypothetical protein MAFF301524_21200 [Ralstonia pseudosolanacearum]
MQERSRPALRIGSLVEAYSGRGSEVARSGTSRSTGSDTRDSMRRGSDLAVCGMPPDEPAPGTELCLA